MDTVQKLIVFNANPNMKNKVSNHEDRSVSHSKSHALELYSLQAFAVSISKLYTQPISCPIHVRCFESSELRPFFNSFVELLKNTPHIQ